MRLKKKSKGSFVGLAGCFGVLGLLAVAMLCPVQNSNVNAADDVTQNVATDTTVFVKSVVSVSLQSAVDVDSEIESWYKFEYGEDDSVDE